MFDVLIKDLAHRYALGDQARPLLGMLLALIFDPRRGGFDGFIDRLRQGGVSEQSVSWVGRGENRPIDSAQVEAALGPELLDYLARKLNVPRSTLTTALTAMLPGAIDKLTPDGVTPSQAAPAFAESYLAPYVHDIADAPLPTATRAHVPRPGGVQKPRRRATVWVILLVIAGVAAGSWFAHTRGLLPEMPFLEAETPAAIEAPASPPATEPAVVPAPDATHGFEGQAAPDENER